MNEKILTRHPQRKSGRSISREKYEQIRTGILALLGRGELTHSERTHAKPQKYRRVKKRAPARSARRS